MLVCQVENKTRLMVKCGISVQWQHLDYHSDTGHDTQITQCLTFNLKLTHIIYNLTNMTTLTYHRYIMHLAYIIM